MTEDTEMITKEMGRSEESPGERRIVVMCMKVQTKKREVNRLGIFLFAQTLDYSECSTTLHIAFSIPSQAFALWGPFLGINHAYNTRVPILYKMWCTLLPNLCYTPLALICESLSN